MSERQQIMHLEVDFAKLTDEQMHQCQMMSAQVAGLFAEMVLKPEVSAEASLELLTLTPYALAMALHAAQAGVANVLSGALEMRRRNM